MRFFWIDASLFIITALLNVLLMFQLFIIKPLLFFYCQTFHHPLLNLCIYTVDVQTLFLSHYQHFLVNTRLSVVNSPSACPTAASPF